MWQLRIPYVVLVLVILSINVAIAGKDKLVNKEPISTDRLREKRSTITIDFGMLLRNILLKSAQLSNAKANITRTLANAKTTRRPPTTTTTEPPPPPPSPPQIRRKPIYGGAWRPYDYNYPYDNEADYDEMGTAPEAAPISRPKRPRPPAPTLPRPPRPDYDYDFDPAPVPAPRQVKPPPLLSSSASRTNPKPHRPAGAPAATQLSNRLIYQYAQPTDIYSRPVGIDNGTENRGGDSISGYEDSDDVETGQAFASRLSVGHTNGEVGQNYFTGTSAFRQLGQQQDDQEPPIPPFPQQQYYL